MELSLYQNLLKITPLKFTGIMLGYWLLIQPAWAAEIANANTASATPTSQRFGVIWRIKGDVSANVDGTTRALQEGSLVYVGEHVRTASTGEAVIKTDDAGIVAIRPATEFVALRFVAAGKKSDNMALRLVSGSLRIITGWIGKLNPRGHRIHTANATIGIRGTDHEPYVLSPELAAGSQYKEGTYDKVNRGKTTLGEGEQTLEIEAGRVGFARKSPYAVKGLMTILMPVLLDKVPDFYVPGQFDAELDLVSQEADAKIAWELAQKRQMASQETACNPTAIAKRWLKQFDRAVVKRDADAILAQFSSDVKVRATVHNRNGEQTTIEFDRNELVQSTVAAAKGLKNYKQRRLTLDAQQAPSVNAGSCDRVSIRSAVVEQGVQSGKPYRLESTERYLLELRNGKWLAIEADTTQR